jgi:cell wall-associated NlpC family hydrolase
LFAGRTLLRALLIGVATVAVLAPTSAALADPTPAEIQAQIDKGNNDVELIVEQYNKVNGDLAATQASLAALEAKLQPLQSSMDAAHANVDQLAVTAYETGSSLRTLSVLLSASSSDNVVDKLATLQQISNNQQREIDTFGEAKKSYDAEKTRLNDLLAAQNAQKIDLETKKKTIEGDIARLDALQKKANAAAGKTTKTSTVTNYGPAPVVSGAAGKVVAYAWAQLNKRYVWGAAGPNTFDCSGLTMMAWKAAGVSLPHNAAAQYNTVHHISRSQLAPGDLVFYNGLGHVGIYIGNNQIIHAPNSRTVVKVSPIDVDPLSGYGRP